jgi:hypothetical protein
MQGESAADSSYHAENSDVGQTKDRISEAIIGALANFKTSTPTDRGSVAALTEVNSRLVRKLDDRSNELKEINANPKKDRADRKGQRTFNPSSENHCCMHG